MALTYSKRLYLLLSKNNKNNFLTLGSKNQHLVPVVHYSSEVSNKKTLKLYLEKIEKSNELFKQQLKEFETGKEFLASMMGRKSSTMTQKDIDDAIEYLFPSGLFVPKARPMMKPPNELFGKPLVQEFDENGRPNDYLFYTLKPKFSHVLHEAAETLERLNGLLYTKKALPKPLILVGEGWLNQLDLEKKFSESVFDLEYEKFVEIFDRLKEHPFAIEAESFIRTYWKSTVETEKISSSPTVIQKGDVSVSHIQSATKKTSVAQVSVSHPGSGKIQINNMGIDYFLTMTPREQVIFPLIFSDMLEKVDVEATVEGGGESSQSSAIRLGIARALEPFVTPEMMLEMKLAGLLQQDFRRRERKKPGREGARRGYTWLKR